MKDTLLNRLKTQPDALTHLLYGLSEELVISKPLPDKWSIYENLVHLARYQEIFKQRIELMLNSDTPLFERYRADDDPGFFEWQKKNYASVMKSFDEDRKALNEYLSSLSEEQLAKAGRHPVFGLMNIEGWTEFSLLHEAHHFFTMLKLAAQVSTGRTMGIYKP